MTPIPYGGPVPAGVLAALLPAQVTVVDTCHDGVGAALFPEEEAVAARFAARRRREFSTVRACARAALAVSGVAPVPILPGPRGEPGWPEGIVGSLTHCTGYRAAAVARSTEVASLGIDAEPAEPLSDPGVLALVSDGTERAALRELAARHPETPWDRLLFSAKESVYKTWFPLTGTWLGFHDARVTLHPGGTFSATLLVPGPELSGTRLTGFEGRWRTTGTLAVTAIALLAPTPSPPHPAAPPPSAPPGPPLP
ncbi:4'-phosphopantetheinyl transferase superfamily protein [Streptomyces sp. NPDC048411]|uniref:4'-phosphopantetheinyl transferase family protein n=1 Tax=Streptomyces sp. NPDC048411 TaxID=3157206 RepID=UPI003452991E